MSHDEHTVEISGRLQRLLFSPKGGIEGLLINVGSKVIQVSMDAEGVKGDALAKMVGKTIDIQGAADHSPKTKDGVHPVYKLKSIMKVAGKKPDRDGDGQVVSGVVADLHYAKHGEPNGVILESGEFIHTRPLGMKKLKLEVGSKVVVHGQMRMTVLGTPLIEARDVNHVALE